MIRRKKEDFVAVLLGDVLDDLRRILVPQLTSLLEKTRLLVIGVEFDRWVVGLALRLHFGEIIDELLLQGVVDVAPRGKLVGVLGARVITCVVEVKHTLLLLLYAELVEAWHQGRLEPMAVHLPIHVAVVVLVGDIAPPSLK